MKTGGKNRQVGNKKRKPAFIPQERDWQAIIAVYNCDVLTKLHIEDWIFRQGDPNIKHTRCKERLPLLVSHNYLWEGWSPSIDGKKPVKIYRTGTQARNELPGRVPTAPPESIPRLPKGLLAYAA